MKKGLRPSPTVVLIVNSANGHRPYEEGIKTNLPHQLKAGQGNGHRPYEEGIKTQTFCVAGEGRRTDTDLMKKGLRLFLQVALRAQ